MCSPFPSVARACALAAALASASATTRADELRVCADPNNLPFSNNRGEGFENRLAERVAAYLGDDLSYYWFAQRRGFLRNTLNAGKCDLVVGVPLGADRLRLTRSYYVSSYMFVQRVGDARLSSFGDPALSDKTIGVQLIGADGANSPPAHELARRGLADHVRGFMVYGDYRDETPLDAVVKAVAGGDVDVALVWGPEAGWFAARQSPPLRVTPAERGESPFPMTFAIAMGVRKDDAELARRLDAFLVERRAEIDAILDEYHVPRVSEAAP